MPYVSTEYAIVSGVRKGIIFAKDPDEVAHTQVLGERNIYQRDDYIIITNFVGRHPRELRPDRWLPAAQPAGREVPQPPCLRAAPAQRHPGYHRAVAV